MESAGFSAVQQAEVEWEQPMTRELLDARVRSVSYVAQEPPAVQQDYVDRVVALAEGFAEPFPLPYRTHLWWAHRP